MKVVKAMKKLKFWSRKKKKKKTTNITDHPPPRRPLPPCQCCHSSLPFQPSAPPLPPWFEYEQTQNTLSAFGSASSSQAKFNQQEIVPELNSLYPTAPVSNTSYQQYMVPNPVYGVPVLPSVRREKKAGLFGCVISIGSYLIQCFCPCLHIRELD